MSVLDEKITEMEHEVGRLKAVLRALTELMYIEKEPPNQSDNLNYLVDIASQLAVRIGQGLDGMDAAMRKR